MPKCPLIVIIDRGQWRRLSGRQKAAVTGLFRAARRAFVGHVHTPAEKRRRLTECEIAADAEADIADVSDGGA